MTNTGLFAVIGVPSVVGLSLGIALMLNYSNSWFFRAMRTFYFVPAITAIVAVSLVWGYLYNTQFGLFNYLFSLVGLPQVQWLSDPILVKFSVVLVAVWRGLGLNTIIFLAALQGVPKEYREAAALDGASEFRTTISVVIPLLRFAIFFVTITTIIAWLQFFDEPFVLTKGGPLAIHVDLTVPLPARILRKPVRLRERGFLGLVRHHCRRHVGANPRKESRCRILNSRPPNRPPGSRPRVRTATADARISGAPDPPPTSSVRYSLSGPS